MRKTYASYKAVLDWAYSHGIKGYTDYIMMARTDKTTDNLANRLTLAETESLCSFGATRSGMLMI